MRRKSDGYFYRDLVSTNSKNIDTNALLHIPHTLSAEQEHLKNMDVMMVGIGTRQTGVA